MAIDDTLPTLDKYATLMIPGKDPIKLPILKGTLGPEVIDIRELGKQGYFTYDPGFVSTASCMSRITFIVRKVFCCTEATLSINWQPSVTIYRFAIFYSKVNYLTKSNIRISYTELSTIPWFILRWNLYFRLFVVTLTLWRCYVVLQVLYQLSITTA